MLQPPYNYTIRIMRINVKRKFKIFWKNKYMQITKYKKLYFEKNLPKSNFDVVPAGRLFCEK